MFAKQCFSKARHLAKSLWLWKLRSKPIHISWKHGTNGANEYRSWGKTRASKEFKNQSCRQFSSSLSFRHTKMHYNCAFFHIALIIRFFFARNLNFSLINSFISFRNRTIRFNSSACDLWLLSKHTNGSYSRGGGKNRSNNAFGFVFFFVDENK